MAGKSIIDEHDIDDLENKAAYDEAVREGTAVAMKCVMLWIPVGAALLLFGFWLSGATFIASDQILEDPGHEWGQAIWPAMLYGLYGLALGSLIGWRINMTSGLVGGPAWRIGTAAVLAVCIIGIVGSMFIFDEGLPKLVWISSGFIAVCGIGCVTFFSKWSG